MAGRDSRRPSEWRRLFSIAVDLIDQLRENARGYDFEWSFGGGTAMMIQISHRESHDIDIFLDDPQLLGFVDPSRSRLRFDLMPSDYQGDGLRYQKFAFEGIGEIDFIVAGALTKAPFDTRDVESRTVRLETIPEIIAKKVYYRGSEARPRDIFDIAAAARSQRGAVVDALRVFPQQVARTRERLERLNPEFVSRAIAQLMIMPDYEASAADSLDAAIAVLDDASI
ncbi:nucleotidyl transferase AbiEii/AbiGii toxin family protein [Mesorhizobium sp. B2-3-11]|uniref:nucleotidyl transferase AbiEii/AbiGii toxin family protein n=1 Tax=Mesorhizobium sp. B2-3-11 TaxID=2589953 RepID=UPI0011274FD5|nr:nucleotidyl transferase AbiEii/AbiGii toxin family protein [Mesorhizobium sp. B2-3-11]TPL96868.1 nucleotidyl transferase AbiEii/AbiGii toxin family protein [Mesorhizobium sp. B2-3-11]